jgi:hypothetical protein
MFRRASSKAAVVHDPLEEADAVLDSQAEVAGQPRQVVQRAARGDVAVQFLDPGLDPVVAGFGRQAHCGGQVRALPADRACVQAVCERLRFTGTHGALLPWTDRPTFCHTPAALSTAQGQLRARRSAR